MIDRARETGLDIRAGAHTGEIELHGKDVAGIAVHIGARVAALAGAGEVLVSATLPPLVVGSGLDFADRGDHKLKGVPGTWRLYAVKG
jgi:class 3 adenylate cyclase